MSYLIAGAAIAIVSGFISSLLTLAASAKKESPNETRDRPII